MLHKSLKLSKKHLNVHTAWQDAMTKEFIALERNKTWDFVPLPAGKKPISCKWVFKLKSRSDGTIDCHKARLVIRGFTQKAGYDYTETFSLVVKMTIIRALVSMALKKNWSI